MSRTLFALLDVMVWTVALASAQDAKPAAQNDAKPAAAQPAQKAELPRCPVMKETVDFNVKTMTADGPVYFCCGDCIKKFEAEPAKYEAGVKAQRAALAKLPKVQTACPISGKEVSKDAFIEKDGQKIYFCCKNCPAKYEKEPAAYKAKLAAAYTYQTKCPVSGEDISPAAYTELPGGGRVYFCCKDCIPKFKADPAKYAPKLEEQGVGVNLKALTEQGEKPADKPAAGKAEQPKTEKAGEKKDAGTPKH